MLYKKLAAYDKKNIYPFHMPGHKRKKLNETLPYNIDITEITGFDNLHNPKGIIKDCMENMEKIYETENSYILINGSTCGLLAAIHGVTKREDSILIARNCHKAVYHGIELRNLKSYYIYPKINCDYHFFQQIDLKMLDETLKNHTQIKTVLITSPSYEGVVLDVNEISKIVHKYGGTLIVDEAHGAHLPFFEKYCEKKDFLPKSAIYQGADIVIQSLHKTLPALTQTAVLHICSKKIEKEKIEKYLNMFQTSSPSYPLMASAEQSIEYCTKKENYTEYISWLSNFRNKCKELKYIHVIEKADLPENELDITRIVMAPREGYLTGKELFELLLDEYHIECEMAAQKYVVAISTICDKEEGFDRLYEALVTIDEKLSKKGIYVDKSEKKADITYVNDENAEVYTIYQAEMMEKKKVSLLSCEKEVAGDYIYLYPPGIPLVVPGERYTKRIKEQIITALETNLTVIGVDKDKRVCALEL